MLVGLEEILSDDTVLSTVMLLEVMPPVEAGVSVETLRLVVSAVVITVLLLLMPVVASEVVR